MSDIHHYHAGQFFAFKTQIGLKLFLFQLDIFFSRRSSLNFMGYTRSFNYTILLFLHKTINNILQQGRAGTTLSECSFPQPNKTNTTETKSQRETLPMPKLYQYHISPPKKHNFHKEDWHTFSANCVHRISTVSEYLPTGILLYKI